MDYSPEGCSGCGAAPGEAGSDPSLQAASLGEKGRGWGWHREPGLSRQVWGT